RHRQPRTDGARLLSRVHDAAHAVLELLAGARGHDPGRARPVRRQQRAGAVGHAGVDRGGGELMRARALLLLSAATLLPAGPLQAQSEDVGAGKRFRLVLNGAFAPSSLSYDEARKFTE